MFPHRRQPLSLGAKIFMWTLWDKRPPVQDDGMNIIETLHFYLTLELASVSEDTIRNTGNPLPKTAGLPRRKHTVPCEP